MSTSGIFRLSGFAKNLIKLFAFFWDIYNETFQSAFILEIHQIKDGL